jgi:CheY-like chemotaxis protein
VALEHASRVTAVTPRAVLVNAMPDGVELGEELRELRRYDWHVIQGVDDAFSLIQALHPDLVVLTMAIDDPGGCRLMSMLQLDARTAGTPLVIYAAVEVDALQRKPMLAN